MDILLLRVVLMRHERVADLEDIVATLLFAHWRNQRVPVRPVVVATLIRAALVHGVQRASSALGILPVLQHPALITSETIALRGEA